MVGGDEPQLQVQVVVPLLHADEVEDVVVLHAAHAVDLIFVLPRQLVLKESTDTMQMLFVMYRHQINKSWKKWVMEEKEGCKKVLLYNT